MAFEMAKMIKFSCQFAGKNGRLGRVQQHNCFIIVALVNSKMSNVEKIILS